VAPERGDVRNTSADTSRAERYLDFAPSTRLAEGLALQFSWVQQHAMFDEVRPHTRRQSCVAGWQMKRSWRAAHYTLMIGAEVMSGDLRRAPGNVQAYPFTMVRPTRSMRAMNTGASEKYSSTACRTPSQ
jgi:hypothetical protein